MGEGGYVSLTRLKVARFKYLADTRRKSGLADHTAESLGLLAVHPNIPLIRLSSCETAFVRAKEILRRHGNSIASVVYTTCTTYDATTKALVSNCANALNQSASTSYGSAANGTESGWWPTSTTDPNGQPSTLRYDGLGRPVQTVAPGEANGWTTQTSYTIWCGYTGTNPPCLEIDTTQRQDATTTRTTRTFYDGLGRAIEQRTPANGGTDVVQYVRYDAAKAIGIDFHPGYFYISGNILPFGAHVVVPPPYSPVTINPAIEELLSWKSPFDGIIAYDVFPKGNPPVYVLPVFAPSFNPWKQWQWNPWILNPRYQPDQSIGGIILAELAAAAAAIAFGGGCANRYQCYDTR